MEFTQGAILTSPYSPGAYVLSEKEYLFYALDTLPILLCFAAFIAFNPALLLPKESASEPVVRAEDVVTSLGEDAKSDQPSTSEANEINGFAKNEV